MVDTTVEEKAVELAKQVDFEKRSKAFGDELDTLIQKHKVGIVVRMSLQNCEATAGNVIIFNDIKPYIQRVDLKRLEEQQNQASKETKDTKETKPKENGKKGKTK